MQALQEMIEYLHHRDSLSPPDLERLEAQGLLAGTSLSGYSAAWDRWRRQLDLEWECPHDFDGPVDGREAVAALVELGFDRAAPRRRRPSGARIKARRATQEVLLERLSDWFERNADRLDGLTSLAAMMGPATGRATTMGTVLAASERALTTSIARILARPGRSFIDLWRAATFRDYRSLVLPDEHGPTAVAFHALADGARRSDLGRYRRALSDPGFTDLMRLVAMQHRVLAAVGRLLAVEPDHFARPLFASHYDETCYWALTLAITANRLEAPSPATIPLVAPTRTSPAATVGVAIAADAALVLSPQARAVARDRQGLWPDLACPPAWNKDFFPRTPNGEP